MATDDIERLHYYQRQYLGALDFEAQQAYHRDMRRRLNLAHHTWGIVAGLELAVGANGVDINITPGMAIDGFGREIVMFTPTQLDPALFRAFHGVGYHTVCLEYTEALTQSPQAGYGQCDQTNQFARVGENFQVVVADPSRDDIMVNSQAIVFPLDQTTDPKNPVSFFKNITDINDPEDFPILSSSSPSPGTDSLLLPLDESVPYQELPADDPTVPITASWLIPLGQVRWDGTTGKQQFAGDKNNPIKKDDRRHYIGSVASRLLTPARNLVVRDRNTNVPLPVADPNNPDGVVMTIEGTLQVDRLLTAKDSIEMDGGALDFRDAGGSSDGKGGTDPLFTITRQGTDTAGIALQIQIGKDQAGKNSFVVSSTVNNNLFRVDDKGNAHLAGSMDGLSITGALDFGSQPRQMINLWTSQDKKQQNAFGIQASGAPGSPPLSATTYFRSSNDFYWFKGGVHIDKPGEPGGGQVQMSLDGNGSLHFDRDSDAATRWRQMINLSSTRYGIGVQDSTLYYRSDFDFCWFQGGSHSNTHNDPGVGGQLQLKLDLNGDLYFGARTRQMLNLWNKNYGIGVQANTLYYRSDSDFCWFKSGSHNDAQDNPGGGMLQMKLDQDGDLYFDAGGATARTRQMLNLWQNRYGIGVQAATLYYRSDSDFCWFKGGSHNDAQDNPGGGTLQMKLDQDGDLYFGARTRQMLNLWNANYGIGVQDYTLYFRSDSDFCWYLGGSPSTVMDDPGPGGTRQMKLDKNGALEVSGNDLSYIAFNSTTHPFYVRLGYVHGPHGADSIYGSPNLWLDAANTVYIKSGYTATGMDGAEYFPTSEPVEAGEVVVLSAEGRRSIKPAQSAYDASVVGVVSTDPAFILGGPASANEIEAMQQNHVAVALIGTVPCKVDADIAPIHIGDLLTTSPTKGYAQKVLDPSKAAGAILGKALENLENSKGVVSILVMMC